MGTRRLTPAELGIENVNLKTAVGAGSVYASNTLDVRDAFLFTAIVDITETGAPANGDAKLTIRCVDKDGNTTYEVDVVTAIDTKTNGAQVLFTWGTGKSATLAGTTGTIGANLDVLAVFDFMEVVLTVTTANDGTTSTGSVTLLLEEV